VVSQNISAICATTQEYTETCVNLAQEAITQTNFTEQVMYGFWAFIGVMAMVIGALAMIYFFIFIVNKLKS
jgi:hypothetical protein